MNLGKRLRAVAELTLPYTRVADIGSDHAYLPIFLIESGRAVFAVAGEVRPGPLAAAQKSIAAAGLNGCIEARLGDGLAVLAPGEVEAAVLSGMGGQAIHDILARSPEVMSTLRRVVCQPMNAAASLRIWLLRQGWSLVAEELVLEDGRLYEIMAAEPGTMSPIEPILLEIGPLLWQQRHPLVRQHCDRLLAALERQAQAMEKSANASVLARSRICRKKIALLEEWMRCL